MSLLMHTSLTSSAPPALDAQPLLWVADPSPSMLQQSLGDDYTVTQLTWDQWSKDLLAEATLAVFEIGGNRAEPLVLSGLLRALERHPVVALFLLVDEEADVQDFLAQHKGRHVCACADIPPQRLLSKLAAMGQLQPAIAELHSELTTLREQCDGHQSFDEELQFAARLQRDFLPRRLPEVGQARFGVLFRPASMVSGDIYDIVRLDEKHVGFYVVDAIGHGLPAALLTMFIKKALQTKRITPTSYEILPPHVALEQLNADICNQELSGCQFCTAAYCILDTETLTLTYARAGHPAPLRISADGALEELPSDGPLLGIFPDAQFETRHCQLAPDDRIVLFTDGADHAFLPSDTPIDGRNFLEVITPIAAVPRDQLLFELADRLNALTGMGEPDDDVTILTMDLESLARSA